MTYQIAYVRPPFLLACSLLMSVSCGSSDTQPSPSSIGGSANTGGTSTRSSSGGNAAGGSGTATGGTSVLHSTGSSVGGQASTGGATSGIKSSTGGAPSGGKSSTGGSSATTNTGGKSSTGGSATASGGTSAAVGGKSSTGGQSSTSTKTSTGGTVATGGASASGGVGTGGKSTAGGASSTGGATGACANVKPIASSTCTAGDSNCFSFFVTSRARLFALAQAFNGSTKGWGGDLRYGTNDGLKGADKICTEIAEQSLPGNCRNWKAFLSTSSVDAVSRVGAGPWYDRLNRLIAKNTTELIATRPGGITSSTILSNLPNEDGTPHHNEEANCTNLDSCADNHDIMTGSDTDGKRCTSSTCSGMSMGMGGGMGMGGDSITDYTCKDWTLSTPTAGIAPRVGHTWPTGGTDLLSDWISVLTEGGCAPGYNLVQNSAPTSQGTGTVGEGGGYGAIYCLAAE